jgi:uncharacterized membrane protein YhiD involved in acid resistance
MALATLLIITVVQASIALSLGLVGALSIVRFRAAIKEPEELTFIFLIIGVGLTCGANKPLLAAVAIVLILPLIYLNSRSVTKDIYSSNKMLFSLKTSALTIDQISTILSDQLSHVELKRLEDNADGLYATFLTKADGIEDLAKLAKVIKTHDANVSISLIDQPEMVL